MLTAALTSRSWWTPHFGQVHSRTSSGFLPLLKPQNVFPCPFSKIRLAKNAEKDKQRQAINRKYEYIQKTFSDYLGYTASILNSHNIQNLDKQTDAFGRIIPLTKQARNVVFYIQSEIGKGNYDNAMNNFENIIDTLSKEETSLLSQLEQHLPKDCKDDFED